MGAGHCIIVICYNCWTKRSKKVFKEETFTPAIVSPLSPSGATRGATPEGAPWTSLTKNCRRWLISIFWPLNFFCYKLLTVKIFSSILWQLKFLFEFSGLWNLYLNFLAVEICISIFWPLKTLSTDDGDKPKPRHIGGWGGGRGGQRGEKKVVFFKKKCVGFFFVNKNHKRGGGKLLGVNFLGMTSWFICALENYLNKEMHGIEYGRRTRNKCFFELFSKTKP